MNIPDRNAGLAAAQAQVLGFDKRTGIDSQVYGAPGAHIFYVDPNNSQAVDFGNLGRDPTVPLATGAAAVALCRDHMGDTIVFGANDAWQYAPPNRGTAIVETLVIPQTKGGIRLVGQATTPMGLSWHPVANNDTAITVNAIDVLIEGFLFTTSGTTGNSGITCAWNAPPYGENLIVRNCMFYDLDDYGIALDYSWYAHIYNNYFDTIATAAIINLAVEGDPDYAHIHDNIFYNCALAVSFPGVDHCSVYRNMINGTPGGADNFIDFTGSSGNFVADNWLSCTIAQYDTTCSDATSGAWVHNHCTDGAPVAPPT